MSYADSVLVLWSNTPGDVPTVAQFAGRNGRIAVNQADALMYVLGPDNVVRTVSTLDLNNPGLLSLFLPYETKEHQRRELVLMSDYVPDDVNADCTAGVKAAFLAGGPNTRYVFDTKNGARTSYKFLNRSTLGISVPNNSTVEARGATLDLSAISKPRVTDTGTGVTDAKTFFRCQGSLGTKVSLVSDGAFATTTVEVPLGTVAAQGLARYSKVLVSSSRSYPVGYAQGSTGQIHTVDSISIGGSSEFITFAEQFNDKYLVADGAGIQKVNTVTVTFKNLQIIGPGRGVPDTSVLEVYGDTGIAIDYGYNCVVENCGIREVDYNGIRLFSTMNSIVRGNCIEMPLRAGNTNTAISYSISYINACHNLTIFGNYCYFGLQGIVQSISPSIPGATRLVNVVGNWVYDTEHAAYISHENAEMLMYAYNHSINCNSMFDIRNTKVRTFKNQARFLSNGNPGSGYLIQGVSFDVEIDGDTIQGGRYAVNISTPPNQIGDEINAGNPVGSPTPPGPARLKIHNLTAIKQSQRAIDIRYSQDTNVKFGLEIIDLTARDAVSSAVYLEGPISGFMRGGLLDKTPPLDLVGTAPATIPIQALCTEPFHLSNIRWSKYYLNVIQKPIGTTVVKHYNCGSLAGQLYAPNSETIAAANPEISITAGSTAETIVATFTRKAYSVEQTGRMLVEFFGAHTNSGGAKTYRLRENDLAGNIVGQFAVTASLFVHHIFPVVNRGQSASQLGMPLNAGYFGAVGSNPVTSTASYAADQVYVLTLQAAVSGDNITLRNWNAEVRN